MTMKPEHEWLLVAVANREAEHLVTLRPESWRTFDTGPYDDVTMHGPEYDIPAWLGRPAPEHERKRFLRALATLEAAGLVETWKRWGRRLSHVKLTETGRAAVARLEKEASCPTP